ncbi:50S ribosomal protein L32e [Candidatus Bathyarchaeota archaeon]|nr:50S ribosomal protein L32e [Candidatus Bathyarchaeota archaeon]
MAEKKPSISRKLLRLRKRAKQKKPEFLRSESWRYSKMSESWRRPRGLDHKMRRKIKGWPPMVSTGYKGPKAARGLHPSGFREVLVHNLNEICEVNPTIQVARISHTVGKKKRLLMVAEAKKRKLQILNPGIEEAGEEVEENLGEEEEPVEAGEVQQKAEKSKLGLFGRRTAKKAAPKSSKAKLEKPKKAQKGAKAEEKVEE